MLNRSLAHLVAVALLALALLPATAHARYTISCSSSNYRYQYCGANTDDHARLVSQRSKAACIRGRDAGAVAAGVGLAILGAIIANQDQDNAIRRAAAFSSTAFTSRAEAERSCHPLD